MPINDDKDYPSGQMPARLEPALKHMAKGGTIYPMNPIYNPAYKQSEDERKAIARLKQRYPLPRYQKPISDFDHDDGNCTTGSSKIKPVDPNSKKWSDYPHISQDDAYGVYVVRMVNSWPELAELVDLDEWNNYEPWEKKAVSYQFKFLRGIKYFNFMDEEYRDIWLNASLIYYQILLNKAITWVDTGDVKLFDEIRAVLGDRY